MKKAKADQSVQPARLGERPCVSSNQVSPSITPATAAINDSEVRIRRRAEVSLSSGSTAGQANSRRKLAIPLGATTDRAHAPQNDHSQVKLTQVY
ncbi:hypothetical protein NBRC116599_35720 [Aquicoccus sp. SU-CL01552]